MLAHEWKFVGRFRADSVENSIPPTLQQFVCMVEHGIDIKSQIVWFVKDRLSCGLTLAVQLLYSQSKHIHIQAFK